VSATSAITQPVGTRRRVRPYLTWLERSRDNWKRRAVKSHSRAARLDRRVISLTQSRDRWRGEALQLRGAAGQQEKNLVRS